MKKITRSLTCCLLAFQSPTKPCSRFVSFQLSTTCFNQPKHSNLPGKRKEKIKRRKENNVVTEWEPRIGGVFSLNPCWKKKRMIRRDQRCKKTKGKSMKTKTRSEQLSAGFILVNSFTPYFFPTSYVTIFIIVIYICLSVFQFRRISSL